MTPKPRNVLRACRFALSAENRYTNTLRRIHAVLQHACGYPLVPDSVRDRVLKARAPELARKLQLDEAAHDLGRLRAAHITRLIADAVPGATVSHLGGVSWRISVGLECSSDNSVRLQLRHPYACHHGQRQPIWFLSYSTGRTSLEGTLTVLLGEAAKWATMRRAELAECRSKERSIRSAYDMGKDLFQSCIVELWKQGHVDYVNDRIWVLTNGDREAACYVGHISSDHLRVFLSQPYRPGENSKVVNLHATREELIKSLKFAFKIQNV